MILLVGFYRDPNPARRSELRECLSRNTADPRLEEIHVFVEEAIAPGALLAAHPELDHPKLRLVHQGRRLTYRDAFDHANRALAGRRVALANADIYFDDSLGALDGYDLGGRLLCLSRWDVLTDGSLRFFEHPMSQDVWIFEA